MLEQELTLQFSNILIFLGTFFVEVPWNVLRNVPREVILERMFRFIRMLLLYNNNNNDNNNNDNNNNGKSECHHNNNHCDNDSTQNKNKIKTKK